MVALDALKGRFPEVEFTIVVDAAMINKDNEKELQVRKIPSTLGARIKNLPKVLTRKVLDSSDYFPCGITEVSDNMAPYSTGSDKRLLC